MRLSSVKVIKHRYIYQTLIMIFSCLLTITVYAEDDAEDNANDEPIEYVPIEPVIVTNYLKKSPRKPGFIQVKAQVATRGTKSVELVTNHMPLIRDFIVEYLSFTTEALIKNPAQRNFLKEEITSGLQEMLTEQVGEPLVENIVFIHFMWD